MPLLHHPLRLIRLLLLSAIPVGVTLYAIWYWTSDHDQLATWYKHLHPFFYKAGIWESEFFTEEVKKKGNYWCLAALASAFVGTYLCWKMAFPTFPRIILKKQAVFTSLIVVIGGSVLSLVANFHTTYSSDEVFSSLNFGSLPLFQTLSYYPLPNNHPLFNSISGWGSDPVMTGRIVSLFCYVGVLLFSWYFLKKWELSNWLNAILLMVVAVQFPVWGFSGQARGYEMVLLFSCLSFGSLYNYFFTGAKHWLPLHTVCNVLGMLTIPTYLYWWLGLLIASLIYQIKRQRVDWVYIRFSVIGFAFSLITYLPLLTFSGSRSITDNKYVRASDSSTWYFLTHLNEQRFFDVLFKEWFSVEQAPLLVGAICVLTPILFYISISLKRNDKSVIAPIFNSKNNALGTIYLSILTAFFLMVILMVKFPFTRNLIAHGYLVLLVFMITLIQVFRSKKVRILIAFLLLLYIGFAGKNNFNKMPYHLYYYDVAGYVNKMKKMDVDIKPGSSVYLDDECFYWWYIIKNKFSDREIKIVYGRSLFNNQDYCIMPVDSFPPVDTLMYELLEKGLDQQIFRKRN